MVFHLTPLGTLVGVFVLAAIAALITAAIIGFRRPLAWHVFPNGGIAKSTTPGRIGGMGAILSAPYGMTRHGPDAFRLPDGGTISITVEADPYSEMADAVFGTPVIPATKFQFEPMPTVVEMTEAEALAIRDRFRAAHPELQKTYSQTRQFPTDPARSDVPGGVYWSIDAQNFYDAAGRAMDQHFTEAWWPRMHEFPQR